MSLKDNQSQVEEDKPSNLMDIDLTFGEDGGQ